jgi:predicted metalloprotease
VAALATVIALTACADDDGPQARVASPLTADQLNAAPPAPTSTVPTSTPVFETTTTTTTTTTVEPPPTTQPLEEIDVTDAPVVEPELLTTIPFTDVVDVDEAKPPRAHDGFVAVAFTDIERWWTEVFPDIYGEVFEPLSGGIYAGYPERTTPIPGCGESETTYADLQLYVAFYCDVGDFMAYDDGNDPDPETGSLLTPLADAFGPAVVGVVLAHEYGHVVQQRTGALSRPLATIVTEQQADCFAGAWTGQAYAGSSSLLRLGDADVRAGLLAMLTVRDPVGTNQFTPGGHGAAFDRVGAFQVGFVEGPQRCATLLDDPLPLVPNEFAPTSVDEFLGGNSPYDCSTLDPAIVGEDFVAECRDAPVFLAEDVNHFWSVALDGAWEDIAVSATPSLDSAVCDDRVALTPQVVVCPSAGAAFFDEPEVIELYEEFGDFTLGYVLGVAAADFAQTRLGSTLSGEARALVNDCFTGAWVRDITPDDEGDTPREADLDGDGEPDSTVTSSPGDLDEAIRMALLTGDLGANVNQVGSAFEKIQAFRTGVLGGLSACRGMLP